MGTAKLLIHPEELPNAKKSQNTIRRESGACAGIQIHSDPDQIQDRRQKVKPVTVNNVTNGPKRAATFSGSKTTRPRKNKSLDAKTRLSLALLFSPILETETRVPKRRAHFDVSMYKTQANKDFNDYKGKGE
jgi:hypothetical protein